MSGTPDERKADIRARMRRFLASMDDARRHEASAAACAHLVGLAEFRRAPTVMLYMALPGEVDLGPAAAACFAAGKVVCVPRVDWARGSIDAVEVASLDDREMTRDERGLRVPRAGSSVAPELLDLVVVPGLAFDPAGRRLGRGAGFYDRFLGRLRLSAMRVGIAFDGQVIDTVPTGDRDLAVDIVVTDRRIAYSGCRRAGAAGLVVRDAEAG
jgi:5-formyltetrahydrofolate cyclo-ligase